MAEENKDLQQQPQEQPQEEKKPRDFEAEMADAVANRDQEKMSQLGADIFGRATPETEEQAQAAEEKKPDEQADAGVQEGDKKTFRFSYRGKTIEEEDENNLLGFQSTGHLKREYLIGRERMRELESQVDSVREESRQMLLDAQNEAARLRKELEGLREQGAPVQKQKPVQSQQQDVVIPEMPALPQRPTLSDEDPEYYTADDKKKLREYSKARDEYDVKMAEYVKALRDAPRQASIPKEIEDELASLRDQVKAANTFVDKQTELDRKRDQDEITKKYWGGIAEFQGKHADKFGTKTPILELNDKVTRWMDNLAAHHGLKQPLTQKWVFTQDGKPVLNGKDWQDYERGKSSLVTRYLNDDKEVLESSEAVKAPDGFKQYFRLSELEDDMNKLKQSGRLGQGATLEDAYLLTLKDSGDLEQGTDAMAAAERAKGAEAAASALEEHRQSAVSVDLTRNAQPVPFAVDKAAIDWFSTVRPEELRDPATFQKYKQIADTLKSNKWMTGVTTTAP